MALIDLLLPDGDGTDLIAELRRSDPAVKVVVLSADLWPWRVDELLREGVDAVLDKVQSRGRSPERGGEARRASGSPSHRAAIGIVIEMYESYSLERYHLVKNGGKKGSLVFRPREGVSPRQDTGRPGQPTRTSVLSAVRGGDGGVE